MLTNWQNRLIKKSTLNRPININSEGEEINLIARKYRIYLLGGWGVNLGYFSISFKDTKTNEIIKCKRAVYPVQAFSHRKRAKRIFTVNIPKQSTYEVIFANPKSVKIRKSNLFISSLFTKPISNEKIEILITEQMGFFPIIK